MFKNNNNNSYPYRPGPKRLHILYVMYLEFNYCLKIITITATLTGPKRLHILYVMYLEFNYCLIIMITIIATLTGPKCLLILYVMYLEFNYCFIIIIIATLSAYTFFM